MSKTRRPIAMDEHTARKYLRYLASGMTDDQIAGETHLSVWTVKGYVGSLYGYLPAINRPNAVHEGYQQGLLVLGEGLAIGITNQAIDAVAVEICKYRDPGLKDRLTPSMTWAEAERYVHAAAPWLTIVEPAAPIPPR